MLSFNKKRGGTSCNLSKCYSSLDLFMEKIVVFPFVGKLTPQSHPIRK